MQKEIDAVNSEGAIIVVENNTTVNHLSLKSNICLYIKKGAVLTVTGIKKEDKSFFAENEDGSSAAFRFIEADGAENITVTGGGTIRGTDLDYWNDANLVTVTEPLQKYDIGLLEYLHFQQKRTRKKDISTKFILINGCKNISISNIIIEKSPGWNLSVEASQNCTISDIVIDSNYHGANTDGIDISATSNVDIKNCYISVGDDAVCLKNDKYYNGRDDINMENISVSSCFIRSATNGFKIGTGVYNNIKNVNVSKITIFVNELYPGTICGVTILVSEGGTLENVNVDGVKIYNALAPIFIRINNRNKFEDKDMTGVMKNITVKNVSATGCELPIIAAGVEQNGKVCYIENVKFENIDVTYRECKQPGSVNKINDDDVKEAADDYPEAWMMGDVPASGIYFRHVKNATYNNCRFVTRSTDMREKIVLFDSYNIN